MNLFRFFLMKLTDSLCIALAMMPCMTAFPADTASRTPPFSLRAATNEQVPSPLSQRQTMPTLAITAGERIFSVTLADHAAARAFVAQLPLSMTLKDFNGTEKIATLPASLPVAGQPAGYTPSAGDLAYYAPWGNLCLFYRSFRYSPGLVYLGHAAPSAIAFLEKVAAQTVTIRVVPEKSPEKTEKEQP